MLHGSRALLLLALALAVPSTALARKPHKSGPAAPAPPPGGQAGSTRPYETSTRPYDNPVRPYGTPGGNGGNTATQGSRDNTQGQPAGNKPHGPFIGRGRYVVPQGFGYAVNTAPLGAGMSIHAYEEMGVPPPNPNVMAGGVSATVELDAAQLTRLLADPLYSDEGKGRAQREVVDAGMASVPSLVALVGDTRPASTAPGSPSVGALAEHLLYEIITPDYRSPHEHPLTHDHARVMFRVEDWKKFQETHRDGNLRRVHDRVRAAIDAFWTSEGQVQLLK